MSYFFIAVVIVFLIGLIVVAAMMDKDDMEKED